MRTKGVLNLSMMAMWAMAAACDPVETSQHAEVARAGNLTVSSDDSVRVGGESERGETSGGVTRESLGQTALPQAEPPRASPAEAARIQILQAGAPLPQSTEVLGVVDVHEPGRSDAQGLEIMKERAAAMHADAVIGVEFHRDDKDFTDLSGLAVRYNDLLRNRPYDVVQEIRVHEGEGKDGDAMGELRRRAAALGADLIIGISWHDNDAEKDGTYLSGTAIRYR